VVEVADQPHAPGVRRPHGERRAVDVLVPHHPGAEHLPQPLVPPLADQVQVELADRRPVPVGVVHDLRLAPGVGDPQPVVRDLVQARDRRLEHPVRDVPHLPGLVADEHLDLLRQRPKRPDRHALGAGVSAQNRMRIMVGPARQPVQLRIHHPLTTPRSHRSLHRSLIPCLSVT